MKRRRRSLLSPQAALSRRPFVALGLVGWLACGQGTDADAPPASGRAPDRQDTLLLASAKVALPPAGVTPADLPEPGSEPARLTFRYCGGCHEVPTPQIHSAADWPRVVRRMWLRIDGLDQGYGVPVPTAAERTAMLRYLIRHALKVTGAALPPGPGRVRFVAVCSRCHEIPDPTAYGPEQWNAVLTRMGERMESMLRQPLSPDDESMIGQYLAAASGAGTAR